MRSNGLRVTESEDLHAYLYRLEQSTEKAQEAFVRASGQVAKDAVIRNIDRSDISEPEHIHIKDDVNLTVSTDRVHGGKVAKIRGGKKTGTLWHIVNDGTYRSRGTHFMDKAMAEVDEKIEGILDTTLAFLEE